MVTIGCTKKLLDRMKVSPAAKPSEVDPLFAWTAAMSFVDRRMMVVFTHDETRFSIVYHGVKAKELKDLPRLFREGLAPTMLASNVSPALVEWYCAHCGEAAITKTAGPKAVARSNKSVTDASWQVVNLSPDLRLCLAEASFINRFFHSTEKEAYAVHVDSFAGMIAEGMGFDGPPMTYPGFRIRAVMEDSSRAATEDAGKSPAAFDLAIPANDSFRDLEGELTLAFRLRDSYRGPDPVNTFLVPSLGGRVSCVQNHYLDASALVPSPDHLDYRASCAVRLADVLRPGVSFPCIHLGDFYCEMRLTVEEKIRDMGTSRSFRMVT